MKNAFIRRSFQQLDPGFHICGYPAPYVGRSEIVESGRVVLVHSLLIPLHPLGLVLLDAGPKGVCASEEELSFSQSFLRGLRVPPGCFRMVQSHAGAVVRGPAQPILGQPVTLCCTAGHFINPSTQILGNPGEPFDCRVGQAKVLKVSHRR